MLSDVLIDYLGSLEITQGAGAGKPFALLPWERRFIRGAFAQDARTAALTLGRGNGKSALVSGIGAASVDDTPLRMPRADTIIAASSFQQGLINFRHILAFLTAKYGELDKTIWRIQDTMNAATIEHRPSGARVRCIGSDPRRAHGLASGLILCDEPAQWTPNTAEKMLAALETSLGKVEDGRLIVLGTRAADDDHFFSKLLDGGADYSQSHTAPLDAPPFQKRTWLKANPSLPAMPALAKTIQQEAARARLDSGQLASFRALRLNQGVSDVQEAVVIDAGIWRAAETDNAPRAGRLVVGVDLGSGAAMSGAAAYWTESFALDCFAVFPEKPTLAERGLADGVGNLYVKQAERGELIQRGGRTSDIGAMMREILARWGIPSTIVCDDWRLKELQDALDAINFPHSTSLVTRRMGMKDGGEDMRTFRRAVLDGQVLPPKSLLLRSAIGGARVVSDHNANFKLAKKSENGRRSTHRDDACAAALLAVSEGVRNPDPRRSRYLGMIPV